MTFTTCGASGRVGPTQAQCNSSYRNNVVSIQGYGIQRWTVPQGVCSITIDAYGAEGGSVGSILSGKGAQMRGTFAVQGGTVLNIVVGQQGISQPNNNCNGGSGGGGGSYNSGANQTNSAGVRSGHGTVIITW